VFGEKKGSSLLRELELNEGGLEKFKRKGGGRGKEGCSTPDLRKMEEGLSRYTLPSREERKMGFQGAERRWERRKRPKKMVVPRHRA